MMKKMSIVKKSETNKTLFYLQKITLLKLKRNEVMSVGQSAILLQIAQNL